MLEHPLLMLEAEIRECRTESRNFLLTLEVEKRQCCTKCGQLLH